MEVKSINRHLKLNTKEIFGVLLFYLFFSILYYVVLFWNRNYDGKLGLNDLLDFEDYWYTAGMQYLFFAFGSVLIWYFGIRLLKKRHKVFSIICVLILIPIVVYLLRTIRYEIVDYLKMGRLTGSGTVWDLYIPVLFLLLQFGFYFAYTYFKETQEKLKSENELRQAALKSELAVIKAQLNPHFLYNVFNTINASIPAENEKTRNMIAQLSDLFRYQLKATKEDFVTIAEELEFMTNYLELEKARFEERLQIEINVGQDLLHEKIPPMLLQPIVENAVKHGLSSIIEGGKISVSIHKENGKLHFEIADTGIGIKDKTTIFNEGIGLTNTQLRLEKIYNSKLEFFDNEPKGLKIKFAI
uniref:sensor histidine kinase n=1 Tax=Flavobacterium sp. TaxID=239 RepID=UPI00404A9BD2